MKTLYTILIFLALTCTTKAEEPFWQLMSQPEGGEIQTNRLIKTQGDTLYIATTSGLYRSTDGAENWSLVKRGIFQDIVVTKNSIIFGILINMHPSYLVRSKDLGINWDTISLSSLICLGGIERSNDLHFLKIDKDDNIYIYYENFICDEKEDIYRSRDYGESWERMFSPDNSKTYRNHFSPYDTLHWSISGLLEYEGDFKYYTRITEDGGKTNKCIFFDENNSYGDIIYLDTNRIFYDSYDIFYSSDAGTTWEKIPIPTDYTISSPYIINDSTLYVWSRDEHGNAGDMFCKTTDRGKNWIRLNKDTLVQGDRSIIYDIVLDKKGSFYCTHSYGITKSIDDGGHFLFKNNGYLNMEWDSKSVGFDRYGNVYIGIGSNYYISGDNGGTWKKYHNKFIGFHHPLESYDGSMLFFVGDWNSQARILRSTDQGISWDTVKIWSSGPNTLIPTKEGVLYYYLPFGKSTDNGTTWKFSSSTPSYIIIDRCTMLRNEKNEFFSSNDRDDMYRTTDEGKTWEMVYENPAFFYMNGGSRGGLFYPGTEIGHMITNYSTHYMTTDNGNTWELKIDWTNEYGNYYNCNTKEMAIDSLGNLWAGYSMSTDYGFTWVTDSSGLELGPDTWVETMGVNANGYVFLAMANRGLYRSRIPFKELSVTELTNYEQYKVFPTPATDKIFIKSNAETFNLRITIYTIEGIELLNTDYKTSIDISHLSPGLYYLKIGKEVKRIVKV